MPRHQPPGNMSMTSYLSLSSKEQTEALDEWVDVLKSTTPSASSADRFRATLNHASATLKGSFTTAAQFPLQTEISTYAASLPKALEEIDAAIEASSHAHILALEKVGVPEQALPILKSWVEMFVDSRLLQERFEHEQRVVKTLIYNLQSEESPATDELPSDITETLSAKDMAARMGVSDETIRRRENSRHLFSVQNPWRHRGKRYPTFQLLTPIAGEPLRKILLALANDADGVPREDEGTMVFRFFITPSPDIGNLTPIEALTGKSVKANPVRPAVQTFLNESEENRLNAVLKAAKVFLMRP